MRISIRVLLAAVMAAFGIDTAGVTLGLDSL